ncbi:MAG: protein kinase [Candidatus Melainabacteria bacterium]|nr:protein kinase [Candidatus Melainabacteria bacterium]
MNVLRKQFPDKIAGRYEVIETLGAGGVGVVLRCKDKVLNNNVAVKVLLSEAAEEVATRFQREARAAARLSHPNLVHIVDCGQTEEGMLFLVMEYLEGPTLLDEIRRRGRYEPEEFLPLLKQIAEGLGYAHKQGVLHRDIKPANVVLVKQRDGSDQVKIVDFGLAKISTQQDQGLTTGGRVFGSPAYISPEAARAEDLDPRSDLYSLGCLIFEALTGSVPFEGTNAFETMIKRLQEDVPSLSATAGVPFSAELEAAVTACLAREAEGRPESAMAVYQAFEEALSFAPEEPEQADVVDQAALPARRKLSRFSLGLIAAVLVSLAGFAITSAANLKLQSVLDAGSGDLDLIDPDRYFEKNRRDGNGIVWTYLNGLKDHQDLRVLRGRRDVRFLKLRKANLIGSGFNYVAQLPLEGLELKDSRIDNHSLSVVGKIKTLTYLDLSNCSGFDDEGLYELRDLKRLEKLRLNKTRTGDDGLAALSCLTNLKELDLSSCRRVTGACVYLLKGLEHLESLSLARTFFESRYLPVLCQFPSLKQLDLSDISLVDNDMHMLAGVRVGRLELRGNPITDKSLKWLAENRHLKHVILGKQMITTDGIKELARKRPDMKIEY